MGDDKIGIECVDISDSDLPFDAPNGYYESIDILRSPDLTRIPADSFGLAKADRVAFITLEGLQTLESGFLGQSTVFTTNLEIRNVGNLRCAEMKLAAFSSLIWPFTAQEPFRGSISAASASSRPF